jgi:hypothetical protein
MGQASITTAQLYMHHVPRRSDADDLTRLVERETSAQAAVAVTAGGGSQVALSHTISSC